MPLTVRLVGAGSAQVCVGGGALAGLGGFDLALSLALAAVGAVVYLRWWLLPALRRSLAVAEVTTVGVAAPLRRPWRSLVYVAVVNVLLYGALAAALIRGGGPAPGAHASAGAMMMTGSVLASYGSTALVGAWWVERWVRRYGARVVLDRVRGQKWSWASSFITKTDLVVVRRQAR